MKKTYVKPQILFDSFELSQDIAAGCRILSNNQEYQCPVYDPELGVSIFTTQCDMEPVNGDSICYHVPVGDNNVFGS